MSAARPVPEMPFELRDLPLDGEGAVYGQIYRALRDAILSGRVRPGTRLPTTRALAGELGISRNTVVSAFEPLRAEGYIVSRVGAGTFVAPRLDGESVPAERPDRRTDEAAGSRSPTRLSRFGRALDARAPRKEYDAMRAREASLRVDFRPCVPDLETLSYDRWRRCLARTAQTIPSSALDYGDPAGHEGLRIAIAHYLGRARGVVCGPEEIVVVSGVAQALDLATRLFLDEDAPVLIEDPHYLGARRAFMAAGARLVGAPVDADGLDLSLVDPGLLERCRLAYVTPSHQFPTGAILSLARRLELLRWAREAGAFVLEDDYDSEFRYAGRAIPSLKSLDEGDRVLYVGTFSKTLLPGLRIAYLVLPPELVPVFRTARWLADWASPVLEQAALARFLESGDFERHLRRARTLYGERRAALLESIDRHLAGHRPRLRDSRAGLHVPLRLPDLPADAARDLIERAGRAGVGLYPVGPCFLDGEGRAGGEEGIELVMGFARLTPEAIDEGIATLAALLG